jgi:hypothetical protein
VTRFEVEPAYAGKLEVQTVGSEIHQELWIPAEELEEFNRHIIGKIEIVGANYGDRFDGTIDPQLNLP